MEVKTKRVRVELTKAKHGIDFRGWAIIETIVNGQHTISYPKSAVKDDT